MKKLIFALVAIVCGVCSANAGEAQEDYCGNTNLSDCISHFDKQCKANNYAACFVLGELHYKQKQHSESKKYFEMVCDKANSKSPFQVKLLDGSLSKKVPAIEAMQVACSNLAKIYGTGKGVRQDKGKALQYDKKACDLGEAQSCATAGFVYLFGDGTQIDYKLAKSYFEKSCEMQNFYGCSMLSVMYRDGKGVEQNLSKAKEYHDKACNLGKIDCDE